MSEWKYLRIKDVCVAYGGATPSSKIYEYWDGEINWIAPSDMSAFGYISKGAKSITELGYNSCGATLVPPGSVIISSRAPIGKVNISTSELCTSQGCKSLVPKRINSKYLAYYLYNQSEELNTLGQGTTFTELPLRRLVSYYFPCPSLADQSRIAKYLDTKTSAIDSRISVLEQKRDAYGRLKKSIINDAVTHGLNPKVKMKDSGEDWIGEIPEHWEVKRFKEFAYTTKGKQTEYLDEQVEGSEIVLTVETLRQDIPTFFNYAIMPDKKQYCTTDDLVVIWDGAGVGELLRAKDGILSSTIAKVTVDETKVLKEYLWLWRYKIEYTLKSIPTGMGIPHLNPTLLNNFMIPVPPLAEQKEIINVLSKQTEKLSDAITLLNAQIEKYKLLKRSLINEVITGQRAV